MTTQAAKNSTPFPFHLNYIRLWLPLTFVAIVILMTVATTTGEIVNGIRREQMHTIHQLELMAMLKRTQLDNWSREGQIDLAALVLQQTTLNRMRYLLQAASAWPRDLNLLRRELSQALPALSQFDEIVLLDSAGKVIVSTSSSREGLSYALQTYTPNQSTSSCEPLSFYSPSFGQVVATQPVCDQTGQKLGVVLGLANMDRLNEIMQSPPDQDHLGQAYLVSADKTLLTQAPPFTASQLGRIKVRSQGIDAVVASKTGFAAGSSQRYQDYRGAQVIGVAEWLPELQAAVVVEQAQRQIFASLFETLIANTSLALSATALAIVFGLSMTQNITNPLNQLAHRATQIAAGELNLRTRLNRNDEIGDLARAFDEMTTQLRTFIGNLEQMVIDRTRELSALYNVTAVASESLDLETTLNRSLQQVLIAMQGDAGVIHLLNETENKLTLVAQHELSTELVAQIAALPSDAGLGKSLIEAEKPLLVSPIAANPQVSPSFSVDQWQTYIGMSLRARGRTVGVLGILRKTDPSPVSAEEMTSLVSIADQVGVIIESAQLRQQAEQVAVMEERARLARDLHDSVTQLLYSSRLIVEAGRESYRNGDLKQVNNCMIELGQIAQQSLKEMRLLIYELRPPLLKQEGLVGALQERLDAVEGRAGITTQLLVDDMPDLPEKSQEALYFIAQEALNNILKHASATSVNVQIMADRGLVELRVTDNGAGFDPDSVMYCGGLGLVSMRERAEELGGMFAIRSKPGNGTTVMVRLETR